MYTGPGNWTRNRYRIGGTLASSTYSELGGGKAIGTFKIGDHLFAHISYRYEYRYYLTTSYKSDGSIEGQTDNIYFSWSNSSADLEDITGYGEMYSRSNFEYVDEATVIIYGREYKRTANIWPIGDNTKDIIIPDEVTSIGDEAFRGLNEGARRYVETHGIMNDECVYGTISEPSPSSTDTGYYLDGGSFLDSEAIDSRPAVVIGSGVRSIGSLAFAKNTIGNTGAFISSVTVRGNVGTIGSQAFIRQRILSGIDFHEGPTAIGNGAFEECNEIEYLNLNDNWAYTGSYGYGSLFYNCYKLKRISPSNTIKNIAGNMYRNCNYLTQITIHDDEVASGVNRRYSLYVDLFAGDPDCLDEEGYLITEVNNNSVIDPEVLAIDWKGTWHRIIAYYTEECLYLYHKGHILKIRMYGQGSIPIAHKDLLLYLKKIVVAQNSPRHNQTPLFIADRGRWIQVCW